MEDNQYEEIQLSNVWVKEHILDVIIKINKFEVIARVGCDNIEKLSHMNDYEITKEKLNGLSLMEAEIEVLKSNAWFKISSDRKFHIKILFNLLKYVRETFYFRQEDNQNAMMFYLKEDFYFKLDSLQKIKESLIDGCAEAGIFLPKKDDNLEVKTLEDLGDEDVEEEDDE